MIVGRVVVSISRSVVKLFGGIAHCGKEQTMRCVDCEYHKEFPVTGNHWCEATKHHKRISNEDAYVDAPCKAGKEKGTNHEDN